jgi:hypothetical protein
VRVIRKRGHHMPYPDLGKDRHSEARHVIRQEQDVVLLDVLVGALEGLRGRSLPT